MPEISNAWSDDDDDDDDDDADFTPEFMERIFHNLAIKFRNYLVHGEPVPHTLDGQQISHELYMKHIKYMINSKDMDPYWINRYLKNIEGR